MTIPLVRAHKSEPGRLTLLQHVADEDEVVAVHADTHPWVCVGQVTRWWHVLKLLAHCQIWGCSPALPGGWLLVLAGAIADSHVSVPIPAIQSRHCGAEGCLRVLPPVHGRRLRAAPAPALPGCPPVLPGSRAGLGRPGCRSILHLQATSI